MLHTPSRIVALLLAAALLAACGGDSNGKSSATKTLHGAAIELPEGVTVDVTVKASDGIAGSVSLGENTAEGVGQAITFGPAGTTFETPATIKLPFSKASYNGSALGGKSLAICVRESGAVEATLLGDPTPLESLADDIDPIGYEVGPVGITLNAASTTFDLLASVKVSHFTTYQVCVVGKDDGTSVLPADGDASPDDDCGGCDDGDPCTTDECTAGGSCTNAPLVCTDDNNPCTTDECNPSFGVCGIPVADGTACVYPDACLPLSSCQAGVCIPNVQPWETDPGGVIEPENGGITNLTDMPEWADFGTSGFLAFDGSAVVLIDTFGDVPDTLPADVSFAELGVLLFGDGDAAPATPHPPWEGATHRLVARYDKAGANAWEGLLLEYSTGAGDWVVLQKDLPLTISGKSVSVVSMTPDLCKPVKFLSQVRRNGVLLWKARTGGDPPTDPNGPPLTALQESP